MHGELFHRNGPAHVIRLGAPLDTSQCIVQSLGNVTDFAVVNLADVILIPQLAYRRDNRCSTGAEYFLQLAFLRSLYDVNDRQTLLG